MVFIKNDYKVNYFFKLYYIFFIVWMVFCFKK